MDATRPDHLEPYGATTVATPSLGALAAEGAVFGNALAVAPITLPAHTTILTGLYPPQTGVRDNGVHRVPASATTLAERLQALGWRTGGFVSAAVLERRYGLDQGFDVYDDDLSAGRGRHKRMVPDRPALATVSAARTWLDGLDGDRPWFLWVHLYDPHAAYSPPRAFRERYPDRPYDGEIAYMDEQIGHLLAHPKIAGNPDVAIIALADHGESLGEHGEQTHGLLAYDSTLHIPLIVKLPGVKAGAKIVSTVSQVDLVPTILDFLHLARDDSLPGHSLMPLLGGDGERETVYAETWMPYYSYGWAKLRVLRRGRWKLIDGPDPELYDVERDPRELSNQFGHEPGIAHDLKRDLDGLFAASGGDGREDPVPIDGAAAERLRSLGYLAGGGSVTPVPTGADPKAMIGVHVALERARVFQDDHLPAQAEAALREVLEKDPRNLSALVDLAGVLRDQGRIDQALEVVVRAEGLDATYARVRMIHADLESQRNHPREALALLDSALALDPHLQQAIVYKAYVLDGLGESAAVEKLLDEALRTEPADPSVDVAYAQLVALPHDDLAGAVKRLRGAVARDPFCVPAWELLGLTLERMGNPDAAIEVYRDSLSRLPDEAELHALLGVMLGTRGGGAEAETHLREAIRLSPQFHGDLHTALGAWLSEHGRLDEALKEYSSVLEREPDNTLARSNRANLLLHLGHPEDARRELQQILAQHPDNPDAHNALAGIALTRENWGRAEAEARAALAANPQLAIAWSNLGRALIGLQKPREAEAAFRRALAEDPACPDAGRGLAVALRRTGRPKEAAELLEQALQQQPTDPQLHLLLGDLYDGPLGDPERARAHYNAALRYDPENPRAAELRNRLGGSGEGALSGGAAAGRGGAS